MRKLLLASLPILGCTAVLAVAVLWPRDPAVMEQPATSLGPVPSSSTTQRLAVDQAAPAKAPGTTKFAAEPQAPTSDALLPTAVVPAGTPSEGVGLPSSTAFPLGATVRINFQHPLTTTPAGYLPDIGEVFAAKSQDLWYGWLGGRASESRQRHAHEDIRYDTFIHLTKGPSRNAPGLSAPQSAGGSDGYNFAWMIRLPAGTYAIELAMGDPVYKDHRNSVSINGKDFLDDDPTNAFDQVQADIEVLSEGLTIRAHPTAVNPTLCFVHLTRK